MTHDALLSRLRRTRAHSLALAAPLSDEDAKVQSMRDANPAKWHLAHTMSCLTARIPISSPATR